MFRRRLVLPGAAEIARGGPCPSCRSLLWLKCCSGTFLWAAQPVGSLGGPFKHECPTSGPKFALKLVVRLARRRRDRLRPCDPGAGADCRCLLPPALATDSIAPLPAPLIEDVSTKRLAGGPCRLAAPNKGTMSLHPAEGVGERIACGGLRCLHCRRRSQECRSPRHRHRRLRCVPCEVGRWGADHAGRRQAARRLLAAHSPSWLRSRQFVAGSTSSGLGRGKSWRC